MKFKKFLDKLKEETTSGDIAGVDSKLDLIKRPKHLNKGKRCALHKELNCEECNHNSIDDE